MGYNRPTATEVRTRTGLNVDIERLSLPELDDILTDNVLSAEAKVFGRVGLDRVYEVQDQETYGQMLFDAVRLRAGATYLDRPQVQVATGSHAPRLSNEATIQDTKKQWNTEARSLEDICAGGLRAARARARAFS